MCLTVAIVNHQYMYMYVYVYMYKMTVGALQQDKMRKWS